MLHTCRDCFTIVCTSIGTQRIWRSYERHNELNTSSSFAHPFRTPALTLPLLPLSHIRYHFHQLYHPNHRQPSLPVVVYHCHPRRRFCRHLHFSIICISHSSSGELLDSELIYQFYGPFYYPFFPAIVTGVTVVIVHSDVSCVYLLFLFTS